MPKRIAYQGIEGSFSHLTAQKLQGTAIGFPTFRDVFESVENGEADVALLPIENTLAGIIYETLDLLIEGPLKIIGAVHTRIEHSLLGLPNAVLPGIKKVLSHPKALAQCRKFLHAHSLAAVSHYDTAGAAADIAKAQDPSCAAIAHASAAQIYGLKVLADNIQDHSENYTRFFLISREAVQGEQCSLVFTLEHRPGSLAHVLAGIAEKDANLTCIISRPLIGKPFEYIFYIEIEHPSSKLIEELRSNTHALKILGTYPSKFN